MTKLFTRLYISVIVILMIALAIMLFAFHYRLDTDFSILTERALDGGVNHGRQILAATSGDVSLVALEDLRQQYRYPIRMITRDQLSISVRKGLSRGDDVLVQSGSELTVLTPLNKLGDALSFGPVAVGDGEAEADMIIAVAAVLILVAVAIAVLLRPLARQFSVLEQTAISIADGNLGARVDVQRVDSAKQLAQAFNTMASRTEALVRTQRELLQAVSHELRTPLARINFAIDLIRTARNDDERESRLNSLDTAAQDLEELVGELLQYVRLENRGLPTVCESVELLPLVEELIEKESPGREAIRFEIGPELERGDVYVIAERSGLARVLSNLIGNAGRFAKQRVVIDATVSSEGATIEVDDDGPGIPSSERERVFEPFVKLDETSRGAGLGLALVERIVTNHGGTVTASANSFSGCRIRTFWPATAGV